MGQEIFRKKSLDKVKSPDSLDDYIQVSNPGVWLLIISIIVLMAGACIWGIFGHIDSTVDTSIEIKNGNIVCYISDADSLTIQEGMAVNFADYEAVITEIDRKEDEGYVCILKSDQTIPDGYFEGKIVVRSFVPLSFVINRGN